MKFEITCAYTGEMITDEKNVIVITHTPADVEGSKSLFRQKVSVAIFRKTLRPAGFRGYNLGAARERSQGRLRVTIAEQLAAKAASRP